MIGTAARGAHHIAPRPTDCPNGGDTDLSMGNCSCQLCDRQSNRTLYGHPADATRVSSCPPDNVDWAVLPTAHDPGFVRNVLRDTTPVLSIPTHEIMQPTT